MPESRRARVRRLLIAEYNATGDELILRLARQLPKDNDLADLADILLADDKRAANRPAIDDFDACLEAAFLMLEQGLTHSAASLQVAKRATGDNGVDENGTDERSLAERIRRKLKTKQDLYLGVAGELLAAKARLHEIDHARENSPVVAWHQFHKTRQNKP